MTCDMNIAATFNISSRRKKKSVRAYHCASRVFKIANRATVLVFGLSDEVTVSEYGTLLE